MEKTEFYKGDFPADYRSDFDAYLFNLDEHRQLQGSRWQSYHLLVPGKKRVLASVHFHLRGDVAESPHRASFGSYQFSKKLSPEALYNFIHQVENHLTARGIKKIFITNPPGNYAPSHAALLDVSLLNQGYRIEKAEISTLLWVEGRFSEKVDAWEKRKLKQIHRARLNFSEVSPGRLSEVYAFISQCRQERKQSISMTAAEMERTVNALPHAFLLFAVFKDSDLAAASICVRINKNILYNFYSAHPKKFDKLSPVVLLMEGMYKWCQMHDVKLLDLGTSAVEGKPNFSLLNFKINLGGTPCCKFTFTKEL